MAAEFFCGFSFICHLKLPAFPVIDLPEAETKLEKTGCFEKKNVRQNGGVCRLLNFFGRCRNHWTRKWSRIGFLPFSRRIPKWANSSWIQHGRNFGKWSRKKWNSNARRHFEYGKFFFCCKIDNNKQFQKETYLCTSYPLDLVQEHYLGKFFFGFKLKQKKMRKCVRFCRITAIFEKKNFDDESTKTSPWLFVNMSKVVEEVDLTK